MNNNHKDNMIAFNKHQKQPSQSPPTMDPKRTSSSTTTTATTTSTSQHPTTTTARLILSFSLTLATTIIAINMAVVNGGGLHSPSSSSSASTSVITTSRNYAKQQQQQQQYSSSSSSSPSSSSLLSSLKINSQKQHSTKKMKNGPSFSNNNNNNVGNGNGFNQLKFDYAATKAANNIFTENTNNNADNNNNNQAALNYELNPHLDVSLIDVEPEANLLFLDEAYFQNLNTNTNNNKNNNNNQQINTKNINNNGSIPTNQINGDGEFVDIRHFSLTNSASSVQLRATYGPFSSRKIINPFSVLHYNNNNNNNDSFDQLDHVNHNHNHQHHHPHHHNHKLSQSSSNNKVKTHRKHHSNGGNSGGNSNNNNGGGIIKNISEQINAYLVTKEVRRSHPVLRVLFYASHLFELRTQIHRSHVIDDRLNQEKSICAVVIVQFHGERLFGTCSPSQNKLGACLAEIVIPALYWPPLDVTNSGAYAAKQQKSSVAKVFYTITHIQHDQQCNDQNFLSFLASSTSSSSSTASGDGGETVSDLFSAENSMNLLHLSDVFLVPFRGSYEEVTNDNVVTVLIPQEPVYPNSKIYIPVKYTYNPEYPVSAFSLRVQVRPGLRILGAQLSHPNKLWQLSIELGAGQTSATVTAFLRDDQNSPQYSQSSLPDEFLENVSQEVYSWLIEVTEDVNMNEINGRIVWQLLYEAESGSYKNSIDLNVPQSLQQNQPKEEHFEKESVKLTSLIDIQKDVMQEIIAITNSKELLNTAILNGRQVSRTMRIYQVSAAGRINDITFQCSCQSMDESILKASTSCTSIYLDGSEMRGSQNATILIRYGSFIGQGNFIVWMPLLPLDVRVSSSKLNQIKGWRVHRHFRVPPMNHYGQINSGGSSLSSSASLLNRFDLVDEEMLADRPDLSSSFISNAFSQTCQLKFQQARIEVYTKYFSSDHDSGREASLINRKHSIRITHIVQNLLRVSDKNVLALRGNIIEGAGVGTANVEIISPITGSVIGSKEVEVSFDRESITKMQVRLVSGIKMNIEPFQSSSPKHSNIWMAKTSFMNTLTKQYQEAVLDARLFFSDRTSVYLSEILPSDYHLNINTFKGLVDNVTRDNIEYNKEGNYYYYGQNFIHEMPRIIALMPGKGESIQMSIDVIRACQKKKSNQPLASAYVNVDVNFELPEQSYLLQNDAIINYRRYGKNNNFMGGSGSRHHSSPSFNINETTKTNDFINKLINPLFNKKKFEFNEHHDFDHNDDNKIKFQRHSTPISTIKADQSSMKFGIFSLASIICIACIIVIIYLIITNHFRMKNYYNHNNHTRTITTTITPKNHNHGVGNRMKNDCKPYLSCLESGNNRISISAVRDWVWISKEELENERNNNNNNKRYQMQDVDNQTQQLRASLLPPKDYSDENNRQREQSKSVLMDDQATEMHITINPNETFTKRFIDKNKDQHRSNCHQHHLQHQDSRDSDDMLQVKTRHIPIPKRKRNHMNNDNDKIKKSTQLIDVPPSPTETPPPLPLHRNTSKQKPQQQQQQRKSDEDPPPIPPHKSIKSTPIRPQKLSLKQSRNNDNDIDDDDEQLEKIDYRNMMKIFNKLKETDA